MEQDSQVTRTQTSYHIEMKQCSFGDWDKIIKLHKCLILLNVVLQVVGCRLEQVNKLFRIDTSTALDFLTRVNETTVASRIISLSR